MKKFLFLVMMLLLSALTAQQSYADATNTNPQTYTVTVPTATSVVLQTSTSAVGGTIDFGTIAASELETTGTGHNTHTVTLGDGSATSQSYVKTNVPTAGANQYKLSATGVSGSTTAITSGTGAGILTVSNGSSSVGIYMQEHTLASMPKLGTKAFSFTGSGATADLEIAASSGVVFTSYSAPLDLGMGVDESSLSWATANGVYSFQLTLTAVGL